MHQLTVTIAIVIALCLTHFSYVDFRFRHRGSVMWFWLARPAPPLLMRIEAGHRRFASLSAIATAFIGAGQADGDRHLFA